MSRSILMRFTLRSLKRNRTRTIVSIIGVVLSCALITAVFTTVTSLDAAMVKATAHNEGSWGAFAADIDAGSLEATTRSDHVTGAATSNELGEAELSMPEGRGLSPYLALRTLPRAIKGNQQDASALMSPLNLVEGHLPTKASEVVLPVSMSGLTLSQGGARSDSALAVGSTLEVDLGQRIRQVKGQNRGVTSLTESISANDATYDASDTQDVEGDRIRGAKTKSLTVVGFYRTEGEFLGNSLTCSSSDEVALTSADAADGATPTATSAWVSLSGFSSKDELASWVHANLGETGTYLHENLLRYQGVKGTGVVWEALWGLMSTLAGLIAVASVSLIYNAFAISVAERTRQFGLLSSLGASCRQLRRTVLGEALVLGVVGIPLGIACGLIGVSVTLSVTHEGFAALLGTDDIVGLSVSPLAILLTVLLSLVVLVVSVWVPAIRAGSVSAIDAIRQTQDVRLPKRLSGRIACGKGEDDNNPLGVAGLVARRNLSRANSRGRVVVSSLAISIALLVTAGYLSLTIESGINASGMRRGTYADVSASVYPSGTALPLSQDDDFHSSSERLVEAAQGLEGISDLRSYTSVSAMALLPSGSVAQQEAQGENEATGGLSVSPEGAAAGFITLVAPDKETWSQLAQTYGADERTGVIAVNYSTSYNDNGSISIVHPLSVKGSLTLLKLNTPDGHFSPSLGMDDAGNVLVRCPRDADATGVGGTASVDEFPLESLVARQQELHVSTLVDDPSDALDWISSNCSFPTYVISPQLMGECADLVTAQSTVVGMKATDSRETSERLRAATERLPLPTNVFDVAGDARDGRLIFGTLQLFCLLFSGIMGLIAVANVFNTLSNSMLLRTREFAILKSVGMGRRTFRLMIMRECASYALRGLGIGLTLALLVNYLIYSSVGIALEGLAFELPWGSMAMACLLSAAVLGLSVAYALHKGKSSNLVESLRMDAI